MTKTQLADAINVLQILQSLATTDEQAVLIKYLLALLERTAFQVKVSTEDIVYVRPYKETK